MPELGDISDTELMDWLEAHPRVMIVADPTNLVEVFIEYGNLNDRTWKRIGGAAMGSVRNALANAVAYSKANPV